MTLPAELRAEAEILLTPTNDFLPERDRAIAALLHRAADALEWRGIDSAPKNGPVLLWGTDEQAVVGEWLNCASPYWLTGLIGDHDSAYTHWQPLPPPPADGEGL